jgi:hypothetical protein
VDKAIGRRLADLPIEQFPVGVAGRVDRVAG